MGRSANGRFNGSVVMRVIQLLPFLITAFALPLAQAEQIKVLHPQGSAHGFVEVTTLEGIRIAIGDLIQRIRGHVVTSRLTIKFFDGSLDDETTVFSQEGTLRLISDHHVQHGRECPDFRANGPYFPQDGCHGDQERDCGRAAEGRGPKKVFSSEGLLAEIKKALAERMLNADFPQADGRNN